MQSREVHQRARDRLVPSVDREIHCGPPRPTDEFLGPQMPGVTTEDGPVIYALTTHVISISAGPCGPWRTKPDETLRRRLVCSAWIARYVYSA
jgi:hypothetical protein